MNKLLSQPDEQVISINEGSHLPSPQAFGKALNRIAWRRIRSMKTALGVSA